MDAAETDGFVTQHIINDMKSSTPIWEDFLGKAAKLHSSLKTVAQTAESFLDAFQKVADIATASRGATRDLGVSLTKMVIRHRSIENKLRLFTGLLYDALICPLHDRLDDWKKIISQIDRDHAKEYKKSRQEMKKMAAEAQKWQKKVKKGKSEHQERYENAMKMANAQLASFEDQERRSLRRVLVEERARFCLLVNHFRPVVDHEIAMLSEIEHLQSLVDDISQQAENPNHLPPSAEDLLSNFKIPDSPVYFDEQSPPPSPTTSVFERKLPSGVGNTPLSPTTRRSGSPVPTTGVDRKQFQRTWTWTGPRHPHISRRSNSVCSNTSTVIARSPSPEKTALTRLHKSRDSVSSHSSNVSSSYSSMSSLGSSAESPSIECLPNPPPPPPVSERPPVPDELPPPPPAFAQEQDSISVNERIQDLEPSHPGRGSWKARPISMQTTDSGCYSSSSGERSPFSSMGQVCPPYGRSDSLTHHDENELRGSESPYAVPPSFYHRRANSECGNSHYDPTNNPRYYQRCNSETGHYNQTNHTSLNISDDLPPPPDFLSNDSSLNSSFNSSCSFDDSYHVQTHQNHPSPFKRSYSIAGRPTTSQLERIIARGRGGPPLRRGKPPPPPLRTTGLIRSDTSKGDHDKEPKLPASGKDLLAQIQRQRMVLKAKAEEKGPSGDER